LPRQAVDRIRIRTIPIERGLIERGLIERGLIERGRLVGAGGGVVIASAEARLLTWVACGASGISRIARLIPFPFGNPARLCAWIQGRKGQALIRGLGPGRLSISQGRQRP
jgi:hypothetical protein